LNLFDSCDLCDLPESIEGLRSLRKLTFGGSSGIANKALKTLPEGFCNLAKLEELVLDKCKGLESLPKNFGKLKMLTHLYMRE
jgi:Leucine-rich repeat (LRR) protein